MNKNILFIVEIISVIILLFIIIIYVFKINTDKFENANAKRDKLNPENDGKMRFDYLNNSNYDRDVKLKYYKNDDKLILQNDKPERLYKHYYQTQHDEYWGYLNNYKTPNTSNRTLILDRIKKSDDIFNNYKVRR